VLGRNDSFQAGGPPGVRKPHIAETIAFVDGLPGCGKTLFSPIVGTFDRLELMQPSYIVEFVCELHTLDRIPDDAAHVLIRMVTDLQLYNGVMGREANLRFDDLSGVWSNANVLEHLSRLVRGGDARVMDRIDRDRPILNLFTHFLLGKGGRVVFEALGPRARFIEIVRHPLYMIKQQFMYMPRWGADRRDFAVCFQGDGQMLPWWAYGMEEEYVRAGLMDRVILMIRKHHRRVVENLNALPESCRSQIVTIPFERFVLDPWPYLHQVETLLGTTVTKRTSRELRKQNVPRKMYAEGIGLKIYRESGWQPPKGKTEADEFAIRREFAAQHASDAGMAMLDALSAEYEAQYLNGDSTDPYPRSFESPALGPGVSSAQTGRPAPTP